MGDLHAELRAKWQRFCDTPFPSGIVDDDTQADLADYDGFVAGIVSRVVDGERIPEKWRTSFRFDEALFDRVQAHADESAISYVEQLRKPIEQAERIDATRSSTGN